MRNTVVATYVWYVARLQHQKLALGCVRTQNLDPDSETGTVLLDNAALHDRSRVKS